MYTVVQYNVPSGKGTSTGEPYHHKVLQQVHVINMGHLLAIQDDLKWEDSILAAYWPVLQSYSNKSTYSLYCPYVQIVHEYCTIGISGFGLFEERVLSERFIIFTSS